MTQHIASNARIFLASTINQTILAARLGTKSKTRFRRLICRQRTDTRRKGEQIMMPSVRRDRTCLSDRSHKCKWFGRASDGLTIKIIAVAACVVLGVRAGDGHEVRDGTQAAGVRGGISRWAFNTVRDYWYQIA